MRFIVWAIILTSVGVYLFISNFDRLPEYGSDLAKAWPFFCIAIGFLILFRKKGRPKKDFFFNNDELEKKIEEINRRDSKTQDPKN